MASMSIVGVHLVCAAQPRSDRLNFARENGIDVAPELSRG
jgi:hypothetical protein